MDKVLQFDESVFHRDNMAEAIANKWQMWRTQMDEKRNEWAELDSFIFATDTTTTSTARLGWKNSTTQPKLCQIRDNLHSNYMAALFPNDKWLSWQAYTKDAAKHDVARLQTGYMDNKMRESNFRTTVSRLALDYIDRGNAFAMASFERRYNNKNSDRVADYVGPKAVRISPYDIVFDPTASSFERSPKIVRSLKKIGDLAKLATINESHKFWEDVIRNRQEIMGVAGGMKADDWEKINQYTIDGFGNLQEYYGSEYVEILEFYGDFFDMETMELQTNRMITVVDRKTVVRNEPIDTYSGRAPIFHVGWRLRPDNLWAMGPLDNLVGLQYRLDHLENLKADAMDLGVHPPLKIKGEVEEFVWGPGAEIHMDENGDIEEVSKNMDKFAMTNQEMALIEDRMELYAGAPREAMGIRTPGEKTAFEVDSLQTAAGRIFQEKAHNFEVNLLEPLLNAMMEEAHRNFDGTDTIQLIDDETGVQQFLEISKDDITAQGVLRPIGARHFAQQANDLISLNNIYSGPIGQILGPHTSAKEMSRLIDNVLNLRGYTIFSPNIGIMEQQETQRLVQTAQEDLEVEQSGPVEGEQINPEELENEDELA